MLTWEHSGFNIHCGKPVSPFDDAAVERLSQYIVRAPISQERMIYIPAQEFWDGVAKIVYGGMKTPIPGNSL